MKTDGFAVILTEGKWSAALTQQAEDEGEENWKKAANKSVCKHNKR
jgi:hypothetical protein